MSTRRQFLTGIGVVGAQAVFGGSLRSIAAPQAVLTPALGRGRRIDVHHHYAPKTWQDAMVKAGMGDVRGAWTPSKSLEEMDKGGTKTAMVSTGQFIWRLGNDVRQKLLIDGCRDANEFGAQMVRDYPGRFGLWAALPLPEIDKSLKEIEYALDTLKADGFGITTSWGLKYLGDRCSILYSKS
jgi:hypothetical protein